jgi:hypothetical protein
MWSRIGVQPSVVTYIYNPSTWKAEVGGFPAQGQSGLHIKTLSQTNKQKKKKKKKKRNVVPLCVFYLVSGIQNP